MPFVSSSWHYTLPDLPMPPASLEHLDHSKKSAALDEEALHWQSASLIASNAAVEQMGGEKLFEETKNPMSLNLAYLSHQKFDFHVL